MRPNLPPLFMAIVLLAACVAPKPLAYKGIANVAVEPVSLSTTNLHFTLEVHNPNRYDLVIKQVDATLMVKNQEAGTYHSDSTIVIPGEADFAFPASIKINNGMVLSGALGFLSTGRVPYSIAGKARAGRKKWQATIPFTYDGLLDLKKLLGN